MSGGHRTRQLPPLAEVAVRDLTGEGRPAVARLAPGHDPHGTLRYLWTDGLTAPVQYADALREPCPPVDVVALNDVEIRSDWTPYLAGEVLADPLILPAYVQEYYEGGRIDWFRYPVVTKVRKIRSPVYVVTHFNMRTYGHFLLEVLLKCLLIRELYDLGLKHPVAFPASQYRFARIVLSACPELKILIYDDHRERLSLATALLPSMMLSPSVHLHDVSIATVKLMVMRLGRPRQPASRVFLSRAGVASFRVLSNEAELASIAQAYGFTVVSPQDLPWADQVRLFASATHVVGEFSSALHNTLFCPPSAKVVCLNWWASVQSAIAVSAGHEIGYILPTDGVTTQYAAGWTEPQPFHIDPALFEERLAGMGLQRA